MFKIDENSGELTTEQFDSSKLPSLGNPVKLILKVITLFNIIGLKVIIQILLKGNFFEMAAMSFPSNGLWLCCVNKPTDLLMFFKKFASCSIPYCNSNIHRSLQRSQRLLVHNLIYCSACIDLRRPRPIVTGAW